VEKVRYEQVFVVQLALSTAVVVLIPTGSGRYAGVVVDRPDAYPAYVS